MYLFTYGTLMQGMCRNTFLQEFECEFIKTAKISGFTLYHYWQGNYPVAIATNRPEDFVSGEIWKIPDDYVADLLLMLDYVEGVGQLYTRDYGVYKGEDVVFYSGIPEVWQNATLTKLPNGTKWKPQNDVF
jgi:gamma-glutamylcyclotransferase (GGCT)/AIG2-like uncharacterized protein YtfP